MNRIDGSKRLVSRIQRVRRYIALHVLENLSAPTRRHVRRYMGRPDGLILNRWFYWWNSDRTGIAIGFTDDGKMLGWDMLFAVAESRLEAFDPASAP